MATNYSEMEIMKYWSLPTSYSTERKRDTLEMLASGGQYIYSLKTDGVFSRAILGAEENSMLQSRGISKTTGTYGRMEDKMLWFKAANEAFNDTTVLLGECYLPNGIDRDVGAITRSLTPRALKMQEKTPVRWRIFDCLCFEGQDLLDTPIEERVKYLPIAAERINHPLVECVQYYPMDESFFENLNEIFAAGGEGVVLHKKGAHYAPGKRGPAWNNIKVKREIESSIDCFIIGIEPAIKDYTGKDIENWNYWEDERTGEKFNQPLFVEYRLGRTIRPITKGYFLNVPGAIITGVYNKSGEIVQLCKVAGLSDEMKASLRDNFDDWYLTPLTIGGMMVSTAKVDSISVRHPYIKSIRKDDIDIHDCTLEKIIGE